MKSRFILCQLSANALLLFSLLFCASNCKKKYLLAMTALIIQCVCIKSTYCQSQFFTETMWDSITILPSLADLKDSILADDIYRSVTPVIIGDLEACQDSGILVFQLPGRSGDINVRAKQVWHDGTDFTWYGEFTNEDGAILLIEDSGNISGTIRLEENAYQIMDFGGYNTVLLEFDSLAFSDSDCATGMEDTFAIIDGPNEEVIVKRSTPGNDVRVLLLYTDEAEKRCSDMSKVGRDLVKQLNIAINNTEIKFSEVRYEHTATVSLHDFTEQDDDPFGDLRLLRARGDIVGDAVHDLRFLVEADLVILLTGKKYKLDGEPYFGLADIHHIGDFLFGFGIVDVRAAFGTSTFTHEIGHLMGGKHELQGNTSPNPLSPLFARAYSWSKKNYERTVIGYHHRRILYFSDPDVFYNGEALGVEEAQPGDNEAFDMGRQLREVVSIVAEYLSSDPALGGSISEPFYGNEGQSYTWCAEQSYCSGLASYFWEASIDGFTYTTIPSTAQCISYLIPQNADLFIRLTISCGTESIQRYRRVFNVDWENCDPCLEIEGPSSNVIHTFNNHDQDQIAGSAIKVFPNPTSGSVVLTHELLQDGKVTIHIVDNFGRIHWSINELRTVGVQNYSVDLSGFLPGTYKFIVYEEDGFPKSTMFVVN